MAALGHIKFDKVVLDCLDPATLSEFYMKLLGWKKGYDSEDFIIIFSEASNVDIGFQKNTDYIRPTWPEAGNAQQQMLHLDFAVTADEHRDWVAHAQACGAIAADTQYSTQWTVMLDPEGHPFCIDAS